MNRVFQMSIFLLLNIIGLPLILTVFLLEKTKIPVLITLLIGLSLNVVYLLGLITQIFKN